MIHVCHISVRSSINYDEILSLNFNCSIFIHVHVPKADPGPARQARAPRFEKKLGFVFVNFDCITRIYFDFGQHTMFTICILSTTLTTKT